MVDLKDSVGDGGANAKHDVAIIQLMLRLINDAKGNPYLNANYTGTFDATTKDAIAAFQKDQGIPTTVPKTPPPPGSPPVETSGLVKLASGTLAKLNAALPAKYADIRAITGTTTVYLPADKADADVSATAITTKADLDAGFRAKVAAVVNTMFTRHKIALAVVGPGWRRTFAEQAAQTNTGAGPGESNHNFGRAVDLGFRNFRWVKGNGDIVKEGGWLGSPDLGPAKSEQLWSARDNIALGEQGLFLTSFKGERVHLQSFDDSTANNRASLAKLLTTVGAMKWQHKGQYQSDLSLGAKFVDAGTAKQIWGGASPITKDAIAAAATGRDMTALSKNDLFAKLEAVKAAAKAIAEAKAGAPPAIAKAALDAKAITAADLDVVKTALKADFEKADTNWSKWVPVP